MKQAQRSRLFVVYCVCVIAVSIPATVWAWIEWPVRPSFVLAALLVAAVVSESLAIDLPRGGRQSISYPLALASLVLFGPAAGGFVAAASQLNPGALSRKNPAWVTAFNMAQLILSAVPAGGVYALLGGRFLMRSDLPSPFLAPDFPGVLLPLGALTLLSLALNAAFVTAYVSLMYGESASDFLTSNIVWAMPSQAALAFLGFTIAETLAIQGVLGLALFLIPLLIARQTAQRYLALRDAYLDTVKSFVAAIEAKDPYTRGHSERVAEFAVRVAKVMGLAGTALERLEFAALLHDLGKVAVPRRVLRQATRLSASDRARIRSHPREGAELVSSVPYIAELASVIAAHHERYDGLGYCDGLVGSAIPPEARILAVVDSYDAMTTRRPYREPLNHEAAMAEILDGSGTQFDPAVVTAWKTVCDEDRPSPPQAGMESAAQP